MLPADILAVADRARPRLAKLIREALASLSITDDLAVVLSTLNDLKIPQASVDEIRDLFLSTQLHVAEPMAQAFGLRFGLVNPAAERWAAQNAGKLVTAIDESTRLAIRELVTTNLGRSPLVTGRLLRDTVGLTPRDTKAVARLVASFDDVDQGLKAGARKAAKMLRARAESIARTETIRAANRGQQAVWDAAGDGGLIPASATKIWIITDDERTCEICLAMDGQVVGYQDDFIVGLKFDDEGKPIVTEPERTPPAHPMCRCSLGLQT